MAEQILAAPKSHDYQLPEADRLALIAQTRYGQRTLLIERQRTAFIARYGDPYGDVPIPHSPKRCKNP